MSDIDRRVFLTAVGAGGAALAAGQTPEAPKTKPNHVIGIQIGAISFLDEGTEKVLDILQEKACVNTLFLATFTYGNGITSRMIPGHPFPDHGVQEYDKTFYGGNYATPHPQYYKNTIMKDLKAPDYGNLDVLDMVIPAGRPVAEKV